MKDHYNMPHSSPMMICSRKNGLKTPNEHLRRQFCLKWPPGRFWIIRILSSCRLIRQAAFWAPEAGRLPLKSFFFNDDWASALGCSWCTYEVYYYTLGALKWLYFYPRLMAWTELVHVHILVSTTYIHIQSCTCTCIIMYTST